MPTRIKKTIIIFFIAGPLVLFATPPYADDSSSSLKAKKAKEGYVLNLKELIKKSKKKIEKVNDKLQGQAKTRRNQHREEKAREYYEKALRLYDEGRYEQAQELWNKAIRITEHPEMQGYVREDIRKTKKREKALAQAEERRIKRLEVERGYTAKEVDAAYKAGVRLYQQKKFLPAKTEFERVEEMFPDHKATRSYLKLIEQEIQKEQDLLIEAKVKDANEVQSKDKKEWKKALEAEEKKRQRKLRGQAETLYEDAVDLYKAKRYAEAQDKFKEIEWILPDYKGTIKYLKKLQKLVKRQSHDEQLQKKEFAKKYAQQSKVLAEQEEASYKEQMLREEKEKDFRIKDEASFVYQTALNLFNSGDYSAAREKFEEVQKNVRDYKATEKFLKRIDVIERGQVLVFESQIKGKPIAGKPIEEWQNKNGEFTEKEYIKIVDAQAAASYKEAVDLFKTKRYMHAKKVFEQLEDLSPDYKSTRKYLKQIEDSDAGTAYAHGMSADKTLHGSTDAYVNQAIETRHAQVSSDTERKYDQAVALFKQGKFAEAKMKFIQVEAINPGYKETREYFVKIAEKSARPPALNAAKASEKVTMLTPEPAHKEINKKEKKKKTKKKKGALGKLFGKKEKKEAVESSSEPTLKSKFNELKAEKSKDKSLVKAPPQNKPLVKSEDVQEKKEGMVDKLFKKKSAPTSETTLSQSNKDKAERFYQRGLWHYKAKEYRLAKEKFSKANYLVPGYRSTEKYMKKIDKALGVDEYKFKGLFKGKKERKKAKKNQKYLDNLRKKMSAEQTATKKAEAKHKKHQEKLDQELKERKTLDSDQEEKLVRRETAKKAVVPKKAKKPKKDKMLIERKKELVEPEQVIVFEQEAIERYEYEQMELELERKHAAKELKRNRKERLRLEKKRQKEWDERRAEIRKRVDMEHDEAFQEKKAMADKYYREGVSLYQFGDYVRAKEKFKLADNLILNYKGTMRYLRSIDKKLMLDDDDILVKERAMIMSEEVKQEPAKKAPVKEVKAKKKPAKKMKAKKVQAKEKPVKEKEAVAVDVAAKKKEKKMAKRLKKLDKESKKAKKKMVKEGHKRNKEIRKHVKEFNKDELKLREKTAKVYYKEGIFLFDQGQYAAAKQKFRSAENLVPKYKSARSYLKKIDKKLAEQAEYESVERRSIEKPYKTPEPKKESAFKKFAKKLTGGKAKRKDVDRHTVEEEYIAPEIEEEFEIAKPKKKKVTKKQVEKLYDEALGLYIMNRIEDSEKKFREFEYLLSSGNFNAKYIAKMRKRVVYDRQKIERQLAEEKAKQEAIENIEATTNSKEERKMALRRQKELEKLEKKVKAEEKKLAAERARLEKQQKEAEELLKDIKNKDVKKSREAKLAAKKLKDEEARLSKKFEELKKSEKEESEITKELKKSVPPEEQAAKISRLKASIEKKHRGVAKEDKKAMLDHLVKKRQKELRKERERIRKELEHNLSNLYSKAVDLNKSGQYNEARHLFTEIESLRPDYKKTRKYLSKLDQRIEEFGFVEPRRESRSRMNLINRALDSIEQQLW